MPDVRCEEGDVDPVRVLTVAVRLLRSKRCRSVLSVIARFKTGLDGTLLYYKSTAIDPCLRGGFGVQFLFKMF